MIAKEHKKILIAPLDWGLGHATRCLPIINYLLAQGHTVDIAAEGAIATLIKENLPQINMHKLSGYNITYANNKWFFALKILQQLPRILTIIKKEHQWLEYLLKTQHYDLVISDNRYGLYSQRTKCVILTHQLQIRSGWGKIADSLIFQLHKRKLAKFSETGVVDIAPYPGLALRLSHPNKLPQNTHYLGWLSQFYQKQEGHNAIKHNQFLVLLSGPEPLRTQLEKILWQQCTALMQYHFCFISGKIGAAKPSEIPANIEWFSHLDSSKLLFKIQQSQAVICRGGYTTLMDLKLLQKPAILIPTPGQTEQEYLAFELSQTDEQFVAVAQNKVKLSNDIAKLKYTDPTVPSSANHSIFKEIIDKWLLC